MEGRAYKSPKDTLASLRALASLRIEQVVPAARDGPHGKWGEEGVLMI